MARAAVTIIVTGRVQGVGFRAFVERQATALKLDGWVRNRRDGSVEILAIGERETIDRLRERCGEGPRLAEVTEVTVRDASDDGTAGFELRPTA